MLHHYTCYNCCKPVGVFLFVKTEITTSEPPDTTRHIPTINVAVDIASKGLNPLKKLSSFSTNVIRDGKKIRRNQYYY